MRNLDLSPDDNDQAIRDNAEKVATQLKCGEQLWMDEYCNSEERKMEGEADEEEDPGVNKSPELTPPPSPSDNKGTASQQGEKRSAQYITVSSADGTSTSAKMDADQLAVMQAVLGGAKFKKPKPQPQDQPSGADFLAVLQGTVGFSQ